MSSSTTSRTVRGHAEGRVQGVSFRASMQQQARRCGVSGWVRNASDGSVAFLVQGEAAAVQQVLDWAGRGPPRARVDSVDVHDVEPGEQLDDFQVRF